VDAVVVYFVSPHGARETALKKQQDGARDGQHRADDAVPRRGSGVREPVARPGRAAKSVIPEAIPAHLR
jgi:hypothetical protein